MYTIKLELAEVDIEYNWPEMGRKVILNIKHLNKDLLKYISILHKTINQRSKKQFNMPNNADNNTSILISKPALY